MALILREASAGDRINAGAGLYVEPTEEEGFLAATKAAFVEENAIAQWAADLEHQVEAEALEGYDQFRDIPEDLMDVPSDSWYGVTSPEMMQGRIGEIRAERERRQIMSTSGWGTFVGSMGGYIASPETLPELMMTGGAGGLRGAARATGMAVVSELAHEAAMHSESYTRTVQESMVNIGLTAFAAAGLGAAINTYQKRQFTKDLTRDLREIAEPTATVKERPDLRSIGAAEVDAEGEKIVHQPWLKWKWLGPVRPLASATSRIAQVGFNRFVEHSYQPGKVVKGIAKDVAFETRTNRKIATVVRGVADTMNTGYRKWADETQLNLAQRKDPRNWAKYQREIHRAMISGDKHTSDAIKTVASGLRTHYDEVYSYAKWVRENKMDADVDGADDFLSLEEFTTKFAESYAPRRYNKQAIKRDEVAFKQELREGFRQERANIAFREAETAAEESQKLVAQAEEQLVSVSQRAKAAQDAHAGAQSAERTSLARVRTEERAARKALTEAKRAHKANVKARKKAQGVAGATDSEGVRTVSDELLEQAEDSAVFHRESVNQARKELDDARAEVRERRQAEKEEGNVAEAEPELDADGNVKRQSAPKGNRAEPQQREVEGNVVEGRSPEAIRESERIEDLKEALDEARFIAKEADEALKALKAARASTDADAAAQIAKAGERVARSNAQTAKSVLRMAKNIRRVRSAQNKLWRGKQRKLQAEVARREQVARGAREAYEGKTADDFLIGDDTDPRYLLDWKSIDENVEASYQRIVNGYDQDVYMGHRPGDGSALKERQIPLRDEDMFERGWLESDMQAMTINYINRLYKPAAMIDEGGDAELTGFITNLNRDYEELRKNAATPKERKRLEKEQTAVRESFETWRDRFYGRTTISTSRQAEAINDVMRTIRNLNVARLMGMVTFISAGDVARTNLTTVFAPELKELGPGLLSAMKTARVSKKEFQRLGIAHEMASYVRTGKVLDDAGMMEGSSRAVEVTNLASRGLMKVTGLAWWTDQMKLLAAAYTQNDLVHKMLNFNRLGDKSRQSMANLGIDKFWADRLDDEMVAQAARDADNRSVFTLSEAEHGYDGKGYVLRFENFEDQELAEHLQNIIFRESERNIVTPAAADAPKLFANDELNKTVFQFQSFLFGAGTSVTVNLGRRMRMKDPKVAIIMSNMMMMGLMGVTLRNAASGRLEEMEKWTPSDYAMNAFDYSSIAPLFMMGFNHANLFTGNAITNALGMETMSRMTNRPFSSLAGPSAGFVEDALLSASALGTKPFTEDGFTPADIRRMRRTLPWNQMAWTGWLTTQGQKKLEEMVE